MNGDLGEEIPEEPWEGVLDKVHTSFICASIVHHTHFTKARLSRIYEDVNLGRGQFSLFY